MMRRWMIVMGTLVGTVSLYGLALQGCTITSGTVDGGGLSTDSGTSLDGTTSTGDSATGSDGGTGGDGGSDGSAGTCGNVTLAPPACDTCGKGKCCSQLKTCYVPGSDCDKYSDCIEKCDKLPDGGTASQAEFDTCVTTVCNATTPKAAQDLYDAIDTCLAAQCKTECGF